MLEKKHWQIWKDYIIILFMCILLALENAIGQYNRIADEILKLDTFPERCRIMDSEPERSNGIRRMVVDNYSVFYVIKDENSFWESVAEMADLFTEKIRWGK